MILLNIVRTIIFWGMFALSVVFIPLFAPLFLLCGENKERFYQSALRFCSRLALFFSLTRVKVSGAEGVDAKQQFIIVSNHSSFLDSIILLAELPVNFKFTAYREGFALPFIKNIFTGAGYVGSGFRREKMLAHSAKLVRALKNRDNIMVYSRLPRQAQIGEFQGTIIGLSKKFNVPVLPVVLKNSSAVLPLKQYVFNSGTVLVRIEKPRHFSGPAELKSLFEQIYAKM